MKIFSTFRDLTISSKEREGQRKVIMAKAAKISKSHKRKMKESF